MRPRLVRRTLADRRFAADQRRPVTLGLGRGNGAVDGVNIVSVDIAELNVFFRDVGQFFSIFLNFWFWLTPIIYPSSVLEKDLGIILNINPMFPVISGFQKVFVEKSWPQWDGIWLSCFTAVILCVFGMVIFRKHSGEMVDEL